MDTSSGAEVRDDERSPVDEPLFGPGSMTWRVHSDRVFAIGGVRALILQALHPLTMAAVAQQRGFEEDFWGRLDRTGRYVSTLTYAPASQAQRLAAQVRGIHRKLRGTDPDTGETFRLDRPDLLLWVHCCEVESFLTTARRAGAPISDADADEYLREQLLTARMIGIPEAMVPTSVREMTQYFAEVLVGLGVADRRTGTAGRRQERLHLTAVHPEQQVGSVQAERLAGVGIGTAQLPVDAADLRR